MVTDGKAKCFASNGRQLCLHSHLSAFEMRASVPLKGERSGWKRRPQGGFAAAFR